MKHLFYVLAFLAICSFNSYGQLSLGFDLGPQIPLITGDGYKTGLGFSASVGSEKFGLGLRTGYQSFSGESDDYKLSIIPIALYYQTYFGKNQEKKLRFFYGGEIGGYSYKTEGEISDLDISASKIYFGGALEFGANYDITKKIGVSIKPKYAYILSKGSSSPIFGINIGVKYVFR